MDPGMPMMPDPTTGGMPAVVPQVPAIDPAKLKMIRDLLMQRMTQTGGGPMPGPMYPAPPILGAPPARPAPQMIPGQPPFGGMSGVRG
jgi:hypothetical protein